MGKSAKGSILIVIMIVIVIVTERSDIFQFKHG